MKAVALLFLGLALLERGISSDENETTKHKEVVDDEVYDLVEQELMRRISTENETLFEKEANQMFIRFLIEFVKENKTGAAVSTVRQSDQNLQSYDIQHQQEVPATNDGQYAQDLYQQTQEQVGQEQVLEQLPTGQSENIQQQQVQVPVQSQEQEQQPPVNWQQPGNAAGGAAGYPLHQQPAAPGSPPVTGGHQFYPHQPVASPQQQQPAAAVTVPPYPYPYPPEAYPGALPPTRSPETLAEVDKLIQQIFRLNITGVLDQSLSLVGSNPVRHLGGGVLKLVFCDPISRLLGRCRGNDTVGKKLHLDNLRFPSK